MSRASVTYLVLAIIAMLVAGFVFLASDQPTCTRWDTAQCSMGEIVKALHHKALDDRRYPASLDELEKEHFPNGVPLNPFTHEPFDYVTTGDRFFLVCYGKDEAPGGREQPEADIIYSERGRLSR